MILFTWKTIRQVIDVRRVLFVITEDWALVSHRLHLVRATIADGHHVAVATRMSQYRAIFEDHGIEVFDWKINRKSLNPVRECLTLLHLISIIWRFKPDLIHAVALKPVIFAGIASRFRLGVPVVSALGGVGFIFSSQKLRAKLLRLPVFMLLGLVLRGRRRALILQNQDDVDLLRAANVIREDRIRLIKGAGVETDLFVPSKIPHGKPLVILPARLLWDKGVGEFVRLAEAIKAVRKHARFVLLGDVDAHNPATISPSQLEIWKEKGLIEHWGRVRHDEMPAKYQSATVVCLPSYREGLPKALLEAASCGRPTVAFDVSGCREIVRSGINGYLVPFRDENALRSVVMKLIDDKETSERLGKRGREIVIEEFSSDIINKQTFDLWDSLLR